MKVSLWATFSRTPKDEFGVSKIIICSLKREVGYSNHFAITFKSYEYLYHADFVGDFGSALYEEGDWNGLHRLAGVDYGGKRCSTRK